MEESVEDANDVVELCFNHHRSLITFKINTTIVRGKLHKERKKMRIVYNRETGTTITLPPSEAGVALGLLKAIYHRDWPTLKPNRPV